MKLKQHAAIAEDFRKVGTTAVAAALVGIFLSDLRLLAGCAFAAGGILWFVGILLTREE